MCLLVMCLVSLDKFQLKSFSHLLTGFVVVVGLSSLYILDVCMCGCSVTQSYLTVTPWTGACQAPLSTEFSRQEYLSGLLFPLQGIFLFQ